MVYPTEEIKQPFERLALPFPNFKSTTSTVRENLLAKANSVDNLLANIAAVLRRVRSSRGGSLRDAASEVGIDNSKLAKLENAEIDIQVGTFLQVCTALGVRVELVYTELVVKQVRERQNITNRKQTKRLVKTDLTRSRIPYMQVIGGFIKLARRPGYRSGRAFARTIGIDSSKLTKIEKGLIDLRMSTLGHILKTLNISLEMEYSLGDHPL
jgi:transcriptional regulator with XRE-family HTH domain